MARDEENSTPEEESTSCRPRFCRPRKRRRPRIWPRRSAKAFDVAIEELAANLATTDDAHLFGENKFQIHAIAYKIAAKAVKQRLAEKN